MVMPEAKIFQKRHIEVTLMSNAVFIAFWAGMCGGVVVGIFLSAVYMALANRIEGDNDNGNDL